MVVGAKGGVLSISETAHMTDLSMWTKIFEERFQELDKGINAVLMEKETSDFLLALQLLALLAPKG